LNWAKSLVDSSVHENCLRVVSLLCVTVQTPFGLAADSSGSKLYVTDWDKKAIFEVDVRSATSPVVSEVIGDVSLPMSVQYTTVSACE